ncbi:Polynucleotide 5'-hydroxyl-kinase grc3 [Didymella heteroderae]|uniref:Polynucleotide 5'-hydroxyl-kinase grc3 n=1 Tax=Didymella heteroderae TaxID=1769908 RepID=A0A9P4X185_9PLEO|nr:Polynucleotide 5'-hydroxyl-kinase grc3 [Didymella heteroderae]
MPVKRRKLEETTATASTQKPAAGAEKPLSAIAAARLRAEAAKNVVNVQETILEPLAAPSSPPAEELAPEYEEYEAELEPVVKQRNVKLCNWQSNPRDIFAESESELSINLDKNTTIALVGHFEFKVSRGAININGANIGAVTRDGQKGQTYRAYVPATHPIFKIRGLDAKNHVQFSSCKEPTPFGKLSLPYEDIWNTGPNFTNPTTTPLQSGADQNETIRSHIIPTDLTNYEEYYRDCVEDLYLTYKNLYSRDSSLPLLINTPSFLYTTHFSLLEQLLARFKPQEIIHLSDTRTIDPSTAEKLHALQISSKKHRSTLHEITAQTPALPSLRSDMELRAMHMQSYFHLSTPPTASVPSWTSTPLSTHAPWEFSYLSTPTRTQDLVGFLPLTEPLPPSSLIHYLCGQVIHILQSSSSQIPTPYTALARTPKSQIPYFPANTKLGYTEPLDPRTTRVVCAALVRGIDPERGVIEVLVPKVLEPMMEDLRPERTVFAVGCAETPGWAYVEDAYLAQYEEEIGERKLGSAEMGPWVEKEDVLDGMGYLGTVRRVRKFITGEKEK